jgi:hypothetical protein
MVPELRPVSAPFMFRTATSFCHAIRAPPLGPRGKAGYPPGNLPTHLSAVRLSAADDAIHTPVAKCRLSHENAGSSNTSLRHARTKAQQLSHHIHSSVSDPAAPISLPPLLTCPSAAIARNISADRLTPLPLGPGGQKGPLNPQVDGLERGGVAREANVKGTGGTGKTRRRASDGSANTSCPPRGHPTDQHNSHPIIG